jgi:hypothetical protein
LKRIFEIKKKPIKVNKILISLRNDNHLSKTFEGTVKNGFLNGFYTNLALISGMVIGYIKIEGQYNLSNGDLKVEVISSKLFWVVIVFNLIAIILLTNVWLNGDNIGLIGFLLFLTLVLLISVAFFLDSRSLLNNLKESVN